MSTLLDSGFIDLFGSDIGLAVFFAVRVFRVRFFQMWGCFFGSQ
jgi:hypothetical protein